jgi:hypothetical protein
MTIDPGHVAARFAAWFPGERLVQVEDLDAMARRFDGLRHQRPATCGAYALSYLLPAIGFERYKGNDLAAEDLLAHLAAVVVEADEIGPSDEIARMVASGELGEREALARFGAIWYRFPVRASDDPVRSGTSATGVARAVAVATDGGLASIPLAARRADGSVQLTEPVWEAVLDRLAAESRHWRWHAICNYETDRLLKPDDPAYRPAALGRADSVDRVPLDDWGVGHFVGVAGLWRPRGIEPWWLLLLDTYKQRGFSGYEPQPAELMRLGLIRTDGREGGLLLVIPRDRVEPVSDALSALGLEIRMWSNGSPEPDDWSWALGR